jgi:hypothetical protein
MAPPAPPARTPAKRPSTLVTVAIMLTIAIMGSLWVPIFARMQPQLGGFPFFYWYQLMWVPIVAILAAAAFLLSRLVQRGNGANGQSPDYDQGEAS